MLPRRPLLLLLKIEKKVTCVLSFCVRKEGNGNVLLSLFVVLLEQKRQWQFNTTKEEGDDNKLPSPFSLQQHYRKRR
jgi:hypothetical protein